MMSAIGNAPFVVRPSGRNNALRRHYEQLGVRP